MAEADKADFFRGDKTVSTTIPGSANTASNQGQSNVSHRFLIEKHLRVRV
jgi:hypothetical protein